MPRMGTEHQPPRKAGIPARRCLTALLGLLSMAVWLPGQSPAPAAGSGLNLDQPRVTYSRSFKGSQPSFLQIVVAQNGQAEFQSRAADNQPLQTIDFAAAPATVARIFQLTRQAKDFHRPLEDRHSKVSYMGTKMLAYDDPSHHTQQVFNFTRSAPAYALQQLFEQIADTGEHTLKLEETMRYDRLGVVKELNLIAIDWDQRQMAEPAIILPVLQKVSTDQDLMEIARKRAAALIQTMAAPPAQKK